MPGGTEEDAGDVEGERHELVEYPLDLHDGGGADAWVAGIYYRSFVFRRGRW